MGWTYTDRPKGESVRDFLQEQSLGKGHEILEFALKEFRTAYAAVKTLETGQVWGCVWHVDTKGDRDFNFGWKTVSEDMGPYQQDCPEKILNLLTPTESECAKEWRARCWTNIKARKSKPKAKDGDTIKFSEPIRFTNGDTIQVFQIQKEGRSTVFKNHNGYGRYKISKWQQREYEILAPEVVQ